jgi:hypothetical protein
MSDSAPDLHMLNVVVGDMAASLDFYHRLGIAVPGGEVAAGGHVQLRMPGGFSLELDTAESARPPLFDAFWGVRYAIVADPDGNDVGLMSPIEESRRTWPPESPLPDTGQRDAIGQRAGTGEVAEQTP